MPSPPPRRPRPALRPRTLRTKIVTSVVAIFACVLLLSGVATVVALQRAMVGQLDSDLRQSAAREVAMVRQWPQGAQPSAGPAVGGGSDLDGDGDGPGARRPPGGGDRSLSVTVAGGGAEAGTVLRNQVVTTGNEVGSLDQDQLDTLLHELDEHDPTTPLTVDLGEGIGSYRVLRTTVGADAADQGTQVVTGLPMAGVAATTAQAVSILAPLSLLSLLAAGAGAAYLVRRDLAPLARVAATARGVSRQDLERGEVAVRGRVPDADTDPQTEVGQVGLALNNLLDTMESALTVRHESEQRVRRFVADASHELRTPLASIRGYAELSRRQDEPVPETVRHALGRVESEALRMQGLVEDLLLLARLDTGRPLDRAPVDLTLLCLDAVSDARAAGPAHRWSLDLPAEPVELVGDEGRLRQVLTNLLANARTHTPAGTTVTVRVRSEGAQVQVQVCDDGPGIPPALQDDVFERFTRGDDSRSRSAGSTGLGLSIVRAVARAHGGRVQVRSRPGRTVFTVTLPVDGPPASQEDGSVEPAGRPET